MHAALLSGGEGQAQTICDWSCRYTQCTWKCRFMFAMEPLQHCLSCDLSPIAKFCGRMVMKHFYYFTAILLTHEFYPSHQYVEHFWNVFISCLVLRASSQKCLRADNNPIGLISVTKHLTLNFMFMNKKYDR